MTSPKEMADRFYNRHPLRWYLMLWLGLVYSWAINWPARPIQAVLLFTGLMLVHSAGHWFSWRLAGAKRRHIVLYSLAQIGLVVTISMVTHNPLITMSLYVALAGMTVILWGQVRPAIGIVVGYLALTIISVTVFTPEYANLTTTLTVVTPLILFVGGGAILFLQQYNERARTQQLLSELETAHRQLAEYADQVEDLTLAAERRRMARELHDTLAQGLAGLILQLEAASSHLAEGRTERTQAIMQQAMIRARGTLAEARQAIADLRQDYPGQSDLAETIRAEVERFTTATGIPCTLELNPAIVLPQEWQDHARRVVSEGLTNVARHAQANQVWVTVGEHENEVEIQVRDNGIGFDPAAVETMAGHYGLPGMRERARLAGGALIVASRPGRGTTLNFRLPLRLVADNHR